MEWSCGDLPNKMVLLFLSLLERKMHRIHLQLLYGQALRVITVHDGC